MTGSWRKGYPKRAGRFMAVRLTNADEQFALIKGRKTGALFTWRRRAVAFMVLPNDPASTGQRGEAG